MRHPVRRLSKTAALLCGAFAIHGHPVLSQDRTDGWKAPSQIDAFTTMAKIDGVTVDVTTDRLWSFGLTAGAARSDTPAFSAFQRLDQEVVQRMNGTRFERRQSGWYLAGQSMARASTVTTTQRDAVDVYGFRLQLSLTGGCMGGNTSDTCTFTPGASVPEDGYDKMWVPTRLNVTSSVGDRISDATVAALAEDGFGRGAEGEAPVGLDILVRNSGFEANEERSKRYNGVDRTEATRRSFVPSILRLEQTLYATDRQVELTRTIRGAVLIPPDDWTAEAAATQLLGWLLPTRRPSSSGGTDMPKADVNNNLFFAANNARIPANGFTVFQSGASRVTHPKVKVTDKFKQPAAWYNGVWIGFTPVSRHDSAEDQWLTATGLPIVIGQGYGEGGTVGALSQDAVSVSGAINYLGTGSGLVPIESLANRYVQAGVTATQQDAILSFQTSRRTLTRLVPHFSVNGNRTGPRSVLCYYGGLILGDVSQPTIYGGGDLRFYLESGMNIAVGGVVYHEPDRENYSNAAIAIDRTFPLSGERQLTLNAAYTHSFDRPALDNGFDDSRIFSVGARVQNKTSSWSIKTQFVQSPQGDWQRKTSLALANQMSDRLTLAIELTPLSEVSEFNAANVGLTWRTAQEPTAASISFGAKLDRYDFGKDIFGNSRRQDDVTVQLSLTKGF